MGGGGSAGPSPCPPQGEDAGKSELAITPDQPDQRRGSAARQIAMPQHRGGSRLPHRLPLRWIAQQPVHPTAQLRRVSHHGQAAGGTQHGDVVGEVAGMRPHRDGAAKTGRFKRILPATWRQQTAADEGDAGQPVPETQFAQRIHDPDALRRRTVPARTVSRRGDGGATFRVTRSDDRQQPRMIRRQHAMGGEDQLLLAGMSTGGEPDRAPGQHLPQPPQFRPHRPAAAARRASDHPARPPGSSPERAASRHRSRCAAAPARTRPAPDAPAPAHAATARGCARTIVH